MNTPREEISYGNLTKPTLPGFGRLGAAASGFLVVAAMVLMALVALQLLTAAVVWTVIAVAVVAPAAFPRKDGYGRYQAFFRRRKHRASERSGHAGLQQGLAGHVPDGDCRLPGLAASTRLRSAHDIHGREFGLICWPDAALYSVVIECFPPGFDGTDKHTVDGYLAHWAGWLGRLNTVEDVVGAAVVVETVPDSGRRLVRAMQRGRVPDAPELARGVSDQIVASYRIGSPQTTVRLTLTLCGVPVDGESDARSVDEMATMIGDLLPTWTGQLDLTGAGTGARPCTAQEITDATRVAFDPSVAEMVEEAQLASSEGGTGTGITWSQAGPISAWNHADEYVHEHAISRTWQMKEPPRGFFFAKTLSALLAPHRDIARKRVAVLYRPENPESSATSSEADVKKARFRLTQGRHARAEHEDSLAAAKRNTQQVALGSPLIRVGMLVTITVSDPGELQRASRAVRTGMAGQARIALRLPRGAQDMAFLASMPLGLVPQVALRTPGKQDWTEQ